MNIELIEAINKDMAMQLPDNIALNELQNKLKEYIDHLVQHNFEKLVSLLYRIDVSESKLKQLLQNNGGKDAAEIIAQLIVERQLQKIKTRKEFKQKGTSSEEEKW
jgi:hypothetical protein